VQPVRRAEPISPRDARLCHRTFNSQLAHKQKSQDRPPYSDHPGFSYRSFTDQLALLQPTFLRR
jgi:hypothetical protein